MAWVSVCPSADVVAGALTRKRLDNGDAVVLTRLGDGSAVAFHNDCPHMKGPLGSGSLHGSTIVCPWHFFRFDLATGDAAGTPASIMRLQRYPVEESSGEVRLEV